MLSVMNTNRGTWHKETKPNPFWMNANDFDYRKEIIVTSFVARSSNDTELT